MIIIPEPIEFEWDEGNIDKNFTKHGITNEEIEHAFWDDKKKLLNDILHSNSEERYIMLAKSKNIILFIVFTIRKNKTRIISARKLNKKEKHLYNEN